MSTDYQATIAKLLAKAESTKNVHEAEAFSQKAEALMLKWGIEEAVVRAKMGADAKPEEIVRKSILYKGVYSKAHVAFANDVCRGLGNVRVFQNNTRKSDTYLILVGHESDVARAVMLLTSLQLQVVSAQREWWKTFHAKAYLSQNEKFKARRQFIMSFGVVVGRRLGELHAKTVEQTGVGTELVLADRGARVDAWVQSTMGKVRKGRSVAGSYHGQEEGRAAGQRASLGNTTVTTGSRARIAA